MNQNISQLFAHVNKPPVLTRHIEFNKFVDMKFGERLKLALCGFFCACRKKYSYQGRLEDCPIAHANGYQHTFVSNHAFRAQLDDAPRLFPANRQESSDRAWHDHVQTLFDMPSLHQQLVYQKLRGGEGGHGYFDVQSAPGVDYAAAVFYERLAPELLVEGMGEFGEDDEHGIEDTIHLKVSQLIVHKRASEQREQALVRAGNTLEELKKLDGARAELNEARRGYDAHRQTLSVEFAALKYVLVDDPIPGVPRVPDEAMPLARAMVLQGGTWFLPDRVMAEFTGESASDVNRRAQERNRLTLEKTDRTQAIEFACHLDRQKQRGGHAAQKNISVLIDNKKQYAYISITPELRAKRERQEDAWCRRGPINRQEQDMTPIILPEGTGNRWQHCINTDHWEDWDNLATDLLDTARDEPDVRTKDDILTLCLVAAERANMADPATGYSMDLFTQEAA